MHSCPEVICVLASSLLNGAFVSSALAPVLSASMISCKARLLLGGSPHYYHWYSALNVAVQQASCRWVTATLASLPQQKRKMLLLAHKLNTGQKGLLAMALPVSTCRQCHPQSYHHLGELTKSSQSMLHQDMQPGAMTRATLIRLGTAF